MVVSAKDVPAVPSGVAHTTGICGTDLKKMNRFTMNSRHTHRQLTSDVSFHLKLCTVAQNIPHSLIHCSCSEFLNISRKLIE